MAKRVQAAGNTHRVRRSDRGTKQDESSHRPGGRVEGAAAPPHGLVRPHLIGLPVYKMTGSGNDFVMLDARVSSPADWSPQDMQVVCARGTGIGADGVVFVGPGSKAGAARMIYYNADGSHAAMCGNAALCSTTLAAHLGIAPAGGMDLETDAGTYRSRTSDRGRAELHLAAVDPPEAVGGMGDRTATDRNSEPQRPPVDDPRDQGLKRALRRRLAGRRGENGVQGRDYMNCLSTFVDSST